MVQVKTSMHTHPGHYEKKKKVCTAHTNNSFPNPNYTCTIIPLINLSFTTLALEKKILFLKKKKTIYLLVRCSSTFWKTIHLTDENSLGILNCSTINMFAR